MPAKTASVSRRRARRAEARRPPVASPAGGPPFQILGSSLAGALGKHGALAASVAAHAEGLTPEARESLREILYADLFSEYDARFLARELRARASDFGPTFWSCLDAWERDEEQHYLVFRTIYGALTDRSPDDLEAEMAERAGAVDFGPIAAFMADEFTLACLFVYDEAATVRAYRASLPEYRLLGPEVEAFVRQVIADEGRHVRNFVKLVRAEHTPRLGDVPDVIARIRDHEHSGAAYGNTFVLDHDDGVWNERIFDDAASLVLRRLRAS